MNRAVLSTERPVVSASTLTGDKVRNSANEDLGKVHDLMIDVENGRIAYAVLSFGGLLGIGDKLFAIPWSALRVDRVNECLVLDVPRERLENAPGFSKDEWPDMADQRWGGSIYEYYEQQPYWTVANGPSNQKR
jgi:sporulation protein YlmC with PRC-barrel domain